MKTPAHRARENSIALEVKKDGLQQRQSGDWMLRFTVAATDMHPTIVAAAMGARFQCVLVEIDDNEMPVEHNAEARDKWRDLGPTKQAGIRCGDPVFWAWLEEEQTDDDINNHEQAAVFVRAYCGVASRSDLDKPGNQEARTRWYNLDFAFQAWRALENA
jgi:hypothetical protein